MIPCLGWAARWGFDFVAIDRGNRSVLFDAMIL